MAKSITHPAALYQQLQIQDSHNETIEQCCSSLPSTLSIEDRLLFISMLNAILDVPTELCYQYATNN